LGWYAFFFAILLALFLIINRAVKKKANPDKTDRTEGLNAMRGASICPSVAPTISRIMGNT
jgi:hypothetical protein